MTGTHARRDLVLPVAQLDAATAASLLDLCGHLQQALWRVYGDEIEAHWMKTTPDQLIYGSMSSSRLRKR